MEVSVDSIITDPFPIMKIDKLRRNISMEWPQLYPSTWKHNIIIILVWSSIQDIICMRRYHHVTRFPRSNMIMLSEWSEKWNFRDMSFLWVCPSVTSLLLLSVATQKEECRRELRNPQMSELMTRDHKNGDIFSKVEPPSWDLVCGWFFRWIKISLFRLVWISCWSLSSTGRVSFCDSEYSERWVQLTKEITFQYSNTQKHTQKRVQFEANNYNFID